MNDSIDYYAVLGVLPDAERVVIVAAYRALASLYHPDKWTGDVTDANKRMAEINVAYGVLGDVNKRKEYDANRPSNHSTFSKNESSEDRAFGEALSKMEQRWSVAAEIYSDLTTIRSRLSKVSHKLSFAFVTQMLETKQFEYRKEIAEKMEHKFLQLHFGDDPQIISFARHLINLDQKEAIKSLNQYIDVLGSAADPAKIIDKIKNQFNINEPWNLQPGVRKRRAADEIELNFVKATIRKNREVDQARWLASIYYFKIINTGTLMGKKKYDIIDESTGNKTATKLSEDEFVTWVIQKLT